VNPDEGGWHLCPKGISASAEKEIGNITLGITRSEKATITVLASMAADGTRLS
jgi:hypothetical protein